MRRLWHGLRKQWFLLGLATLIPAGLWLGHGDLARQWSAWTAHQGASVQTVLRLFPRGATALILFLMALSLEARQLRAAVTRPLPVVWAVVINAALIPLLAWPLVPLQPIQDFRVGLMIAASVPCTMATASVWTRKAKGNDAISLMVTMLTNAASFAIAPFWLHVTLGASVKLNAGAMAVDLLVSVLLPAGIGQLLRLWGRAARFADRHKAALGAAAQVLILCLVFIAAWRGGARLGKNGAHPGWPAVAVVWGCCVALHLTGLGIALGGAWLAGWPVADTAAVAFAASQKTLPVGVLLATDPQMFGSPALGVPFAVFPMLMYHASQLFLDTAVADRFAATHRN